ncbi:MAG: Amine oxidase, flavin-containing [Phenylobacterium sp.]|nr:Amine oxidase, flavin-containing [Phenylobacterium sp.]
MIEAGSHVVVVGGGAAGLSAARVIARRHRVTLVEAEPRLGGHAWTWRVPDGPDEGLPLDLGFMVLNDRNYPAMHEMLGQLGGLEVANTEMSFGFWDEAANFGFLVNGPPGGAALDDPRFRDLLKHILRFRSRALRDLATDAVGDDTLGGYLERHGVPAVVAEDYLLPMGAAIWSTAPGDLRRYPAQAFLAFFHHHGLLSLEAPPQWQHLRGGSCRYVEALLAATPDLNLVHERAARLFRSATGVTLELADGAQVSADYAVVATHADQALGLLAEPTPLERLGLAPWTYQTNHAVLHTDEQAMPPRAYWGCWNARRRTGAQAQPSLAFTYYLNRLQNHAAAARNYFLTLAADPADLPELADDTTLLRTTFRHPVFSRAAMAGARRLDDFDACGQARTFFCGSYFGYGFHEDAIRSGARMAEPFGPGG